MHSNKYVICDDTICLRYRHCGACGALNRVTTPPTANAATSPYTGEAREIVGCDAPGAPPYSIRRRHLISAKRNVITRSVYVIAWRMASPKVYVIDAPTFRMKIFHGKIVGDGACQRPVEINKM